jgi:hypothetical protein
MPVQNLSPNGKEVMRSAQQLYQTALSHSVKQVCMERDAHGLPSHSVAGEDGWIARLSKLIMWLAEVEKVVQIEDDQLSLLTLFNIAEMGGSLPYEFHVRKSMRT